MGTVELKSSIHKIVDGIQNERLLRAIHDFLKLKESENADGFWNTLTEEQKQQVLLAFDESEDEDNLVEIDKVFKSRR